MNDDESSDGPEQFANAFGVGLGRKRRVPPRLPTGTIELFDDAGLKSCILTSDARAPSAKHRAMAKQVRDLVEQVERASADPQQPVPIQTMEAVERAYWGAFPWPAWFPWFFEYLVRARVAWYRRELADRIGPDDALEAGRAVLRCTRGALAEAEVFCPLLPRWLSPQLVALLIQRLSFGRGGGPGRALSIRRMRKLLLTPSEMARYLRTLGAGEKRFSDELTELDRAKLETAVEQHSINACSTAATSTRALVPSLQHHIKTRQLRRIADQIESPQVPVSTLNALYRAHLAAFHGASLVAGRP